MVIRILIVFQVAVRLGIVRFTKNEIGTKDARKNSSANRYRYYVYRDHNRSVAVI